MPHGFSARMPFAILAFEYHGWHLMPLSRWQLSLTYNTLDYAYFHLQICARRCGRATNEAISAYDVMPLASAYIRWDGFTGFCRTIRVSFIIAHGRLHRRYFKSKVWYLFLRVSATFPMHNTEIFLFQDDIHYMDVAAKAMAIGPASPPATLLRLLRAWVAFISWHFLYFFASSRFIFSCRAASLLSFHLSAHRCVISRHISLDYCSWFLFHRLRKARSRLINAAAKGISSNIAIVASDILRLIFTTLFSILSFQATSFSPAYGFLSLPGERWLPQEHFHCWVLRLSPSIICYFCWA